MKANKDPRVQIRETDQNFYHVEHTRIIRDSTGKHPSRDLRIQIYSKKDYNATFGKGGFVDKHGLGAMNDDEVRVVHDPVLKEKLENEAIIKVQKAEAAKAKEAKAAEAKAKKDKITANTNNK